jgi:hypothetical protein
MFEEDDEDYFEGNIKEYLERAGKLNDHTKGKTNE